MKIAFVSYDFPEYCIRQVNEMVADHDVLLMIPGNGSEDHRKRIDPAVRFEPFHRPRYRQPFRQLMTMIRILRKVRADRPDVVHFQNGHLFFNWVMSLLNKFPLVITIHDPRQHLGDHESNRTPQALMDYGFKRADHVIVHGTDLKPIVTGELGFPEERVHVIPHVAIGHCETDDTGGVDAAEDEAENDCTLLFFGRIWEYKGLEYLIRAEPKISAEFPNVRIVIGGKGEDFDRYRSMMVHPERFEIHNDWISDKDRARMFAAASVVVLPYIEATQSGVIPIAYNHEKPVIATRTGGLPDMVAHGDTGLLIPPRDSDAIAEAAIELLRDKQRRRAMGRAGKEKLDRECSPPVVARQTLEVYRKAIADFRGGHHRSAESGDVDSPESADDTATLRSAKRIQKYLVDRHVVDGALIGPDPGVRFNYRIWRFLKSYFPRVNWNDDLYYLQGQGYWIHANWMLSQLDDDGDYADVAVAATDQVLERQREDGAWDYPNPEWKGRVATVEGIWASLGLMESYRRSGETMYLDAVLRWHEFFEQRIGFREFDGNIAVNYFADKVDDENVPNNSALALRYFANMADVTGEQDYLDRCDGLLRFIRMAQLPSGEVPYVHPSRVHFQCFQYQAFLYLDVLNYYRLTGDENARGVLAGIIRFLQGGISPEGYVYYQCGQKRRTVNYHTGVVAAAFSTAEEVGEMGCMPLAERAFGYMLRQQREDGSIPHSRGDYVVLSDRRSYPRYLAMMIFHLVSASGQERCRSVRRHVDAEESRVVVEDSV